MAKMTGGEFVAKFLNAQGVGAIFFVPTMLSRALAAMDDMPIKRVLTHGEKAAAYMADGYARASRRPGVCAAQAVGAANLAAGLRDAYMAHSPVIALTGGRFGHQKYKVNYQECDDYPTFHQMTKANFEIDTAARFPDLLRQAFREATTGTPGPVNLLIAGKEGDIEADSAEMELIAEEVYSRVPAHRPAPEEAHIMGALQILKAAERPVIVVGGGARWSGAGAEVLKLAEKLSIPIAASLNGLSLVPDNHPLYIGVPGTYSRSCTNRLMRRADLVLYVGSQTSGQVTHFWKFPTAGTPVIQIGIDPSDLGRNYPNKVSLLGDAKVTLQLMNRAIVPDASHAAHMAPWTAEAKETVKLWREEVASCRDSDAVPIRPERILEEVGSWLPNDAIVVSDTGHAGMWCAQQLWIEDDKSWDFLRASGSLGWAFPASLGAKVAMPKKPVVCFTGDGGFWYHLQELETAVRCGIPTVTVVNNNDALNQETMIFDHAYGGKQSAKASEMWHFSKVDFSAVAEKMGALGIRVTKPGEMRSALDQAISSGRPAVVEVLSDIKALAPNPWEG
ncbi:MAG: thiamine pyrophosphate-binding protein [Acidobacteriia bacterium]|nr:thiamine pyrophosphate-binding protein [Terriglobia bacterium]